MTAEQTNQVWREHGSVPVIPEGSIFEGVHDAVAQALSDHFEVQIYAHASFEQPIEVTNDMVAPCIIMVGPDLREVQSPLFDQTFDTGVDEAGRAVTETYHHIECYDFLYSIQFDGDNQYTLLKAMEQWVSFFKVIKSDSINQKGFLDIFGRPFQICKLEQLSPLNIRNYTDVSSGRGSFKIERVPIANTGYVFESKRVYNINKQVTKRS